MTYPWPNVTLVTLDEKQENSNCQKLLALYVLTRPVMHQNTATVEQQRQTDLKINTCVQEGSDSKVIWSLSDSGCRHLLYKSFHMPQLKLSDRMRSAKSKCWISLDIVASLMRIWSSCSHHRATSMITRREPIFQISARSVIVAAARSLDWVPLWRILCTALASFLWWSISGRISPEHKNALTQKVTHRCTHKHMH